MNIDEYDVLIETAQEDLREAKNRLDYWYLKMREATEKLHEVDELIKVIENSIAFYKELRENALMKGEDEK